MLRTRESYLLLEMFLDRKKNKTKSGQIGKTKKSGAKIIGTTRSGRRQRSGLEAKAKVRNGHVTTEARMLKEILVVRNCEHATTGAKADPEGNLIPARERETDRAREKDPARERETDRAREDPNRENRDQADDE